MTAKEREADPPMVSPAARVIAGDPEYLRVSQAAEILGVSVNTVRNWSDRGWLASIRWPNGYRRFKAQDVLRLRDRGVPEDSLVFSSSRRDDREDDRA
jgi:excisionase family DNA binding protein